MKEYSTIHEGLVKYGHYIKKTNKFSTLDFFNTMEPIFLNTDKGLKGIYAFPVNILIIHSGGVGDFILFTPCIREIKRIYENSYITLIITKASYNLAEYSPYVDKVIVCEFLHNIGMEQEVFYDECVKYIYENIGDTVYDIAFNFSCTFSGTLLSYMSGSRVRFFFLTEYDWRLYHRYIPYKAAQDLHTTLPPYKQFSSHMVDKYLSVIDNILHYPVSNRELEIWYSQEDNDYIEKIFPLTGKNKIIALCMGGTGGGMKSYPPSKYASLLNKILEVEDVMVVIVGGDEEKKYGEYVTAQLPIENVFNFTSKLSFRQTAALLNKCDCYIGNDTSCMHIAAALKIPVLAVFSYAASLPMCGLSLMEKYYPYHVQSVLIQPDEPLAECCNDDSLLHELFGCSAMKPHCITQITVEELYEGYCALMHEIEGLEVR